MCCAGEAEDGDEVGEPRFRHQALAADVTQLLMRTAATCLTVSDKMLALGTAAGSVHLLDYGGNEARMSCARSAARMHYHCRKRHNASVTAMASTQLLVVCGVTTSMLPWVPCIERLTALGQMWRCTTSAVLPDVCFASVRGRRV